MLIICEPQCTGFEHTEVNAALITAVSYGFPAEEILFLAEPEHMRLVKEKLVHHAVKGISYAPLGVPTRHYSDLRRLPGEIRLCEQVFELADRNHTDTIIFSSVTSPGLYSIKLFQHFFRGVKCIVIPHGILEFIIEKPFVFSLARLFWFRNALVFKNADQIRYMVLGPSIEKELSSYLPIIKKHITSIDLPYFLKESELKPVFTDNVIRFGYFGVANRDKGSDLLFKIAGETHQRQTAAGPEFTLIGHITNQKDMDMLSDFVKVPSPDTPLSREDFDTYAKDIDYAIYFLNAAPYKLRASGALFDAFSYAKPIIALRNPFFEYYFETMGDIGYLCSSYEEMKEVVVDILNNKPADRYSRQQNNILLGRQQFSLEKIGERIARLWDE